MQKEGGPPIHFCYIYKYQPFKMVFSYIMKGQKIVKDHEGQKDDGFYSMASEFEAFFILTMSIHIDINLYLALALSAS